MLADVWKDTPNLKHWLLLGRETREEVQEGALLLSLLKAEPTRWNPFRKTNKTCTFTYIHTLQADVNTFLSGKTTGYKITNNMKYETYKSLEGLTSNIFNWQDYR